MEEKPDVILWNADLWGRRNAPIVAAMLDTGLCILAKKVKKPALIAIFVVSFVCCLGMGYLSSKDFEKASMNWIAEGVNFCGQGLFLLGVDGGVVAADHQDDQECCNALYSVKRPLQL